MRFTPEVNENVSNGKSPGMPETCTVPNVPEIEQAILGLILNNNETLNKIADFLSPEHFFVPLHQKMYDVVLKFMDRGLIATPLTMKSYFNTDPAFKDLDVDCFDYLLKLIAQAPLIVDIESLGRAVLDSYMRRQLITIGKEVINDAYNVNIDNTANNCLEAAEQKLFNLATQGTSETNVATLKSSVLETLHRIEMVKKKNSHVSGVSTGFVDLDRITGGLQNSDLIIIAARPSMGKTSLAVNIALNAAVNFQKEYADSKTEEKQKSVVIFSLEMSAEQIATRILSIRTDIDSGRIRVGNVNAEEFTVLSSETSKISNLPLFIDDGAALSISTIRTRSRRMKRKHDVGLIVIDYLQLIRPSFTANYGNRVQEIGEVSQGLKALSKELDIPVIALSQLSRAVENREDKRPQLSDLRESGNIEQDADIVTFLYREEYYLSRSVPVDGGKNMEWQETLYQVRNIAELIISKHRNGPIGTCLLHFNSVTTGFHNSYSR
ncbi:Replicative DNA helicase [Alphaproteobacteria bacterium]